MLDRLLSCSLHVTILSLITGCAAGALLLTYTGLFKLVGPSFTGGAGQMMIGLALGVFVFQLCRYRNELIDW